MGRKQKVLFGRFPTSRRKRFSFVRHYNSFDKGFPKDFSITYQNYFSVSKIPPWLSLSENQQDTFDFYRTCLRSAHQEFRHSFHKCGLLGKGSESCGEEKEGGHSFPWFKATIQNTTNTTHVHFKGENMNKWGSNCAILQKKAVRDCSTISMSLTNIPIWNDTALEKWINWFFLNRG